MRGSETYRAQRRNDVRQFARKHNSPINGVWDKLPYVQLRTTHSKANIVVKGLVLPDPEAEVIHNASGDL